MSVCNSCWRSSTSRAWSATPHALGIRSTLLCLFRASPGRTPPRRGPPSARPPVVLASTAAGADTGPTRKTAAPGTSPRVCILGGGFGGLYTAIKLENLLWPAGTKPLVTLIDQGERFTFKPLLYELLNGTASENEVAPPFAQLLAPYPITFLQAKVESVHPVEAASGAAGGTVKLVNGATVEFDWLVLALGSGVNTFGIPGVKQYALPFVTYDDAVKVAARLDALDCQPFAEVVVVGGGYSGVELAAVVAERLQGRGRVKLITNEDDVLTRSPPGTRTAARAVLTDRSVSLVTRALVKRIDLEGGEDGEAAKRLVQLEMTDGGPAQTLEADLVLWAAGMGPSPKVDAVRLPFPANERGCTQTDETLQVLGNDRVFALGDIAVCTAGNGAAQTTYPATAQVAFQQADYVAWNVWASINRRARLPFQYQHLGELVSLGRLSAAATLPVELPVELRSALEGGPLGPLLQGAGVRLGSPDGRVTIEGPLAQAARRLVYLYRQPTVEQQVRVGSTWLQEALGVASKVLGGIPPGQQPPERS